jgi:hypothetical protein
MIPTWLEWIWYGVILGLYNIIAIQMHRGYVHYWVDNRLARSVHSTYYTAGELAELYRSAVREGVFPAFLFAIVWPLERLVNWLVNVLGDWFKRTAERNARRYEMEYEAWLHQKIREWELENKREHHLHDHLPEWKVEV